MPIFEYDRLMKATLVPEISKIKIGDRGGKNNAPNKTEPTVTPALKPKGGKNFATDVAAMSAIKGFIAAGNGTRPANAIPVRLFTDEIDKNIMAYRGIFNAANTSMCMSLGGNPKAMRRFKEKEYRKGILPVIDEVFEVDCDDKCQDWRPPGVKGNCMWHANLAVMLDIPGYFRFPSRTVFRTSGFKVMENMIGSLNAIRAVTGGILANIPLWLVMHEVEGYSRAMNGRSRYPVMSFEYWGGGVDALRNEARREMASRRALAQGINPAKAETLIFDMNLSPASLSTPIFSGTNQVMDNEDATEAVLGGEEAVDLDSIMSLLDEGDAVETGQPSLGDVDSETTTLEAEARALKGILRLPDMSYEMLTDKHDGDMTAVVAELRVMAKQPTPGAAPAASTTVVAASTPAPAGAAVTTPPATPAVADADAFMDLLDMGGDTDDRSAMAEESDMPAEDDPEVIAMQSRAEEVRAQGVATVAAVANALPPAQEITPPATVVTEVTGVGSEDDEDSPWFVG